MKYFDSAYGKPNMLVGGVARVKLSKAVTALLLASGAGAAVLGVSGCGRSTGIDPLAQAADITSHTDGARILTVVTASADGKTLTIHGAGYQNERAQSGWMTMVFPAGSKSPFAGKSADFVYQHSTVYMKLPVASSKLPEGKPWVKIDYSAVRKGTGTELPGGQAQSEASPSEYLNYLRGTGSVERVGDQTIDGVPTTHYHATIELSRVAQNAPADERASAERAIEHIEKLSGQSSFPVEVWIDAHKRIRREHLTTGLDLAGKTASLDETIDYVSFGPIPPIVVPAESEVFDGTEEAVDGVNKELKEK